MIASNNLKYDFKPARKLSRLAIGFLVIGFIISFQGYAQNNFRIWGTTIADGAGGTGTIFSVLPDGSNLLIPKAFSGNSNGSTPWSGVIQGTDGYLYGTNTRGGPGDFGNVYKIKADGTGFTVIHEFGTNGSDPWGGLVQVSSGDLIGMTSGGGNFNGGILYKLKMDGSGFDKLLDLSGKPQCGLIQGADGYLYGTETQGSTGDNGSIFKVRADGTGYTLLFSFGTVARSPAGNLLIGADGSLYGTTLGGSVNDGGILYRINTDGTGFTKLFDFTGPNGQFPTGSLIQDANGVLYGLTGGGGATHLGIVYKINPNGSGFTILKDFLNLEGGQSRSGLVFTAGGDLIGMNSSSIFTLKTDGSAYSALMSFNGLGSPSGFIRAADGNYYGTTNNGGTSNNGSIFRFKPDGTYTKMFDYPIAVSLPQYDLIHASNGDLYSVSAAGGLTGTGNHL